MREDIVDDEKQVADLLDQGDVVMITTAADGLRARPLTCAAVEGDRLSFLVSSTTDWVEVIDRGETASGTVVGLTCVDQSRTLFTSMSARVQVLRDTQRAEELWSPAADTYFTGPADPDLRVLVADVLAGEWWDTVSGSPRLVAARPPTGTQGTVATEAEAEAS